MRTPMDAPRMRCCIDGCGRSTKDEGRFREWMCAKHYAMSSRLLRNRFKRIKATLRSMCRKLPVPNGDQVRFGRIVDIEDMMWRRIKNAAAGTGRPAGLEAILDEIGIR